MARFLCVYKAKAVQHSEITLSIHLEFNQIKGNKQASKVAIPN